MGVGERITHLETAVEAGTACEGCRQLTVAVGAFQVFGLRGDLPDPDAQGFVACERCGERLRLEPTEAERQRLCELVDALYGASRRRDRFAPVDDADDDADVFDDVEVT